MILVTGGFGFIGSNLIRALNARGMNNIIIVDDITNGRKVLNLLDGEYEDLHDVDDFFDKFNNFESLKAIFHLGAISSTTEWNGKKVMKYNYKFSCNLLNKVLEHRIPISYASSASVYGINRDFSETAKMMPLNLYAYSKMLFDKRIMKLLATEWFRASPFQIQGWRYFNVYGRGEDHKEDQASPIYKFIKEAQTRGTITIFKNSENYLRDFICVEDVVQTQIDFLMKNHVSGIFNMGTGNAVSFKEIAEIISSKTGAKIVEIEFPNHLKGHYQEYTCANLTKLREAGCGDYFRTVQEFFQL